MKVGVLVPPLKQGDSETGRCEERCEGPVVIDGLVVGGRMISRTGPADLNYSLILGIGKQSVGNRDPQTSPVFQEVEAEPRGDNGFVMVEVFPNVLANHGRCALATGPRLEGASTYQIEVFSIGRYPSVPAPWTDTDSDLQNSAHYRIQAFRSDPPVPEISGRASYHKVVEACPTATRALGKGLNLCAPDTGRTPFTGGFEDSVSARN